MMEANSAMVGAELASIFSFPREKNLMAAKMHLCVVYV